MGDSFTILDSGGTYDADEGTVVHIMDTENFKLDADTYGFQFKKPEMLSMENE